MRILGIETSCDETALALIEASGDVDVFSFSVIETALNSQIKIHQPFGGVFPALAKREHAKNIVPLLETLLHEQPGSTASFEHVNWGDIEKLLEREDGLYEKLRNFVETYAKPDVDMIAVTSGPGLEPALWVGINVARALSFIWNIPVLPVNHMEGHIVSVLLESPAALTFPMLSLLISGGHTEFILVDAWGSYTKIGATRDDAIGEAYDKVARMLGLPYPGGPEISTLAQQARDARLVDETITLPRPMMHTDDFDFSLSGLKTAVLYLVQKLEAAQHGTLTDTQKMCIANEFEQAVVDVLVKKTQGAIEQHKVHGLIVGGGVIANTFIREQLTLVTEQQDIPVFFPTRDLSTDNAVMIAAAGFLKQLRTEPEIGLEIRASGNLSLE